jgi:hypothetical protein
MTVISTSNLKYYWSGGSADGVGTGTAAISLGSFRSATVVTGSVDQIFADVSGDDAASGKIYYKCIYIRNEDANAGGWITPVCWIDEQVTPTDANDVIAIGLGPTKNATAVTIANQNTAPSGVSFTTPITKGTGLALPGAPYAQNDKIDIWIRLTIAAGCAAANPAASIRVEGDSQA